MAYREIPIYMEADWGLEGYGVWPQSDNKSHSLPELPEPPDGSAPTQGAEDVATSSATHTPGAAEFPYFLNKRRATVTRPAVCDTDGGEHWDAASEWDAAGYWGDGDEWGGQACDEAPGRGLDGRDAAQGCKSREPVGARASRKRKAAATNGDVGGNPTAVLATAEIAADAGGRASRPRRGRRGKSFERTPAGAIENFYADVIGDCGAAPPALPALPESGSFGSAAEYYHAWYMFAVVEARAAAGLGPSAGRSASGPSRTFGAGLSLKLESVEPAQSGALDLVTFVLEEPAPVSVAKVLRPAAIFVIESVTSWGREHLQPRHSRHRSKGARWQGNHAEHEHGNGSSTERHFGVVQCWVDNPSVAGETVRFWVPRGAQVPQQATARFVSNVITQQRAAVAARLRPSPPFLFRLLGSRPATHIIFDSSEDDADDGTPRGATGARAAAPLAPRKWPADGKTRAGALNPSQASALEKCVAASQVRGGLELVQGPPGCGKTHFLAALLLRYRDLGKRVMVCAPSNKAVTVALEHYVRASGVPTNAPAPTLSCALAGVQEELLACSPVVAPRHLIYTYVDTLEADVRARSGALKQAWLDAEPATCPDDAVVCRVRVGHTSVCARKWDAVKHAAEELQCWANTALEELKTRATGVANGLISSAGALCEALGPLLAPDLWGPSWPCRRGRRAHPTDTENLRASVQRVLSAAEAHALAHREVSPEARDAVGKQMLNTAAVVFCTLGSAGSSVVRTAAKVDVLVVDEAAQALEGDLLIAMQARPDACVLIGDPQQLPAFSHSDASARAGYARSLLERLMLTCKHAFSLLATQYRMHPAISRFPFLHFYKGEVGDADYVASRPSQLPARGSASRHPEWLVPYAFLNVRGGLEVTTHNRSIKNPVEADVVAEIVRRLAAYEATQQLVQDCVVVTFYAAQRDQIAGALRSQGLDQRGVSVHTVDSFQGSEAAVVICSFVRCSSGRAGAHTRVGFLSDYKRLNVALTRAKHCLLLCAHWDTLASSSSPDLAQLARDAKQRGLLFDAPSRQLGTHPALGARTDHESISCDGVY